MPVLLRASWFVALLSLVVACGGDGGGDRFLGRVDVNTGNDVGFLLDTPTPDDVDEADAIAADVPAPDLADTLLDGASDAPDYEGTPDGTADLAPDTADPDPLDASGKPRLKVTPNPLDFGEVASEGLAQRELTLENVGDTTLTVSAWALVSGETHFVLLDDPADEGEPPLALEPGQSRLLVVAFDPGALPAGPVAGKLRFSSDDPVTPHLDVPLKAKVVTTAVCTLTADQAELAFGAVEVGCDEAVRTASFSNPCPDAVVVTKVRVKGGEPCTLEFSVQGVPGGPIPVAAGGTLQFQVRYRPQSPGADACKLALATSLEAPDPEVALAGSGVGGAVLVTDSFHQVPGNKADVLFVVDGSGSMIEHVEALAADADALVQAFQAHGTDFHLGVVGISGVDDCATAGDLIGDPPYLTAASSPSLYDVVAGSVDDPCANSGSEQGLAAASLALSPAKTAETSSQCTFGFECGPGLVCVDGLCGGPNRGFLRADAALHVLVISDEDDQSPGTVESYGNGFRAIKGPANPDLFRFHAIVGKPNQTNCPDGSYAEPGLRYREVAAQTGGKTGDICTNDFEGLLADIGDVGIAFKTAWTLSQPAEPASVSVAIGGVACGEGYTYVEATGQVVVDLEGPCLPGPGQTLTVSYATACQD